jgi:GntR family transcriptional regulator
VWSTETEGRDLAVDQVEVSESDAPEHVRALLGLEQGSSAVLRSRRYVLDGKPVLLSRSWLPTAIASGTPIARLETGPGGIYARLADLGHAPARFREDIRSRMPLPAEADRLQIAAGTPVVEICRVAIDADGTPRSGRFGLGGKDGCRGIIRAREEGGHNSRACLAAGRGPVPAVGRAARPSG